MTSPEIKWNESDAPNAHGFTTHATDEIDFGVCDEKGRKVGGIALIERDTRGMYGAAGCVVTDLGTYRVATRALRNGSTFGASPAWTRGVATLEAAKALAAKKLDEQGKRYAKKFGAK